MILTVSDLMSSPDVDCSEECLRLWESSSSSSSSSDGAFSILSSSCSIVAVVVMEVVFFKQKTAYEMLRSLVGSEMCIRDSHRRTGKGKDVPKTRATKKTRRTKRRTKTSRRKPPSSGSQHTRRNRAVSYTHLTLPTIYSV